MKRLYVILLLTVIAGVCRAGAENGFDGLYREYRNAPMPELKELGAELLSRNSTDSAMAVYTIMSNRYESGHKPEDRSYAVEARNSLGVISFLNANYAAAYSHFVTAIEMDGRPDAAGNMNLSAIYLYYGDRRRAFELLRNVFDEAVAKGHYYWASASLINILTSEIDSSVVAQDSVVDMIRKYNNAVPETDDNPGWALASHLSRARLHEINGNYLGAIREYRLSLSTNSRLLIPQRSEFASYIGLGNCFGLAGNNDSAVFYLKKAESLARDNGFSELLINAYAHLSDFYAKIGNQTLSDVYRYKKLELNDSVFNTHEFGKIRDLEMFHEADKFEKRISVLKMEERMRTRTLWIVAAGLALFMSLCAYIFAQNRSLRRKNRILYENNVAAMRAEQQSASVPTPQTADTEAAKYSSSSLDSERGAELERKIQQVMSDEALFCREGFSLKDLADLCESNSKYVSQVLNDRMDTTFAQLLNERRVSVARKRFVDFEHYGYLTIEAIVAELGFRSRSTFSKTFKRITGLNPSEFQRMARIDAETGGTGCKSHD